MAKIVKLIKDGIQIYPQTITEAIADVRTRKTVSSWMETTDDTLIEHYSGITENSGRIDDLSAITNDQEIRIKDAEFNISANTENIALNADNIDTLSGGVNNLSVKVDAISGTTADLSGLTERVTKIEAIIGSGSTTEFIDNLVELLRWFSGVSDSTTFIEFMKKYVSAVEAEDIPSTEEDESLIVPDFDDILGGNSERPEVIPNDDDEQAVENTILAALAGGASAVTVDGIINNLTIPSSVTKSTIVITGFIKDGATIVNESNKTLKINNTNEEAVSVTVDSLSGTTYLFDGTYNSVYAATKNLRVSGESVSVKNVVFGTELEGLGDLYLRATFAEDALVTSYNSNNLYIYNTSSDGSVASVRVYAPNATVTMDNGYSDVTAVVSENTLILAESFKANSLTVNKGNVIIRNGKGFDDAVGTLKVENGTASIYTRDVDEYSELDGPGGIYNIVDDMTYNRYAYGMGHKGNRRYNINHNLTVTGTYAAFYLRGISCTDFFGEGTVTCATSYGVWTAYEATVANIYGGKWYGESHAVYCENGTINIYGGEFGTVDDEKGYVINCLDKNYKAGTAKINVYGGKFYGFNPADCISEGEHTSFVADGYKSVETSYGVWEVVSEDYEFPLKVIIDNSVYLSPALSSSMNSEYKGVFSVLTKNEEGTIHVKSSLGFEDDIPLRVTEAMNNIGTGLIVGHPTIYSDLFVGSAKCPNCSADNNILEIDTNSKAICPNCGRKYDLNIYGVLDSAYAGKSLNRYRGYVTDLGNKLVAFS